MRISILIIILFLYGTIADEIELPISLEIEWVLQGAQFGFQGFFVEFLGISSVLKYFFPQLRIMQSIFRRDMNELAIPDGDIFLGKLFAEEKHAVVWATANTPDSYYYSNQIVTNISSCSHSKMEVGVDYFGGDLSRNVIYDLIDPTSCCYACSSLPSCLMWTFYNYTNSYKCNLRGSSVLQGVTRVETSEDVVSGSLLKSVENPSGRMPLPRIQIFHGTSCFYQNNSIGSVYKRDIHSIWIGRFMVERGDFSNGFTAGEYSVIQCAARMDEIWVPTEWNKQVFLKLLAIANVPVGNVVVIPESVDTKLFNPSTSNKDKYRISFPQYTKHQINNINEICNPVTDSTCTSTHFDNELFTALNRTFNFLSIFKWEYRKGWDILLEAYWSAFRKEDNVVLRLRTYVPSSERKIRNLMSVIDDFAQSTFGKSAKELARVVIENYDDNDNDNNSNDNKLIEGNEVSFVTRMDMRDLLASVDAFVLPTRGEGWGLPIAEAMAMELPVIVTNYSGPTAFVTENNGYLIPVSEQLDNEGYAVPIVSELISLLQQVVMDSSGSSGSGSGSGSPVSAKGRAARETMQRLSPLRVVSQMANRIRVLAGYRGWKHLPS